VGDQIYTSGAIDLGSVASPATYTFTSTSGQVIFNTGAGSSLTPTLAAGSSYHVIAVNVPSTTSEFETSAGLVLSEIARNTFASNDANYQRKSGVGESGLEIVCVSYDDDGKCRFDD
jgi:hypothetical protein